MYSCKKAAEKAAATFLWTPATEEGGQRMELARPPARQKLKATPVTLRLGTNEINCRPGEGELPGEGLVGERQTSAAAGGRPVQGTPADERSGQRAAEQTAVLGVTTIGQPGDNEEQPVPESGASFVLQGKRVSLGRLHALVQERGGWSQCSKDKKWNEIKKALGFEWPMAATILKEQFGEMMAWMERGGDVSNGDGERKLGPGETLLVTRKGVRSVSSSTMQTHSRWGDIPVPQTYYKDMIGECSI